MLSNRVDRGFNFVRARSDIGTRECRLTRGVGKSAIKFLIGQQAIHQFPESVHILGDRLRVAVTFLQTIPFMTMQTDDWYTLRGNLATCQAADKRERVEEQMDHSRIGCQV